MMLSDFVGFNLKPDQDRWDNVWGKLDKREDEK